MPSQNREPVYAAAFALIASLAGQNVAGPDGAKTIAEVSRVLKHWTKVPPEQQPAVYFTQTEEDNTVALPTKGKWKLNVAVWIYVTNDSANGPVTYLNNLADMVETALVKPAVKTMTGRQTLNVVTNGQVTSLVEDIQAVSLKTDEGWLGPQAVGKAMFAIYLGG